MRFLAFLLLLCSTASAGWVDIQPISSNEIGGMLGDIDAQMAVKDRTIYRDEDKLTWGHETSHCIHSRLRTMYRVDNGYYLLKNRGFTISSPKITLQRIAQAIPQEERGRNYQLYLVDQQKYWNADPLYVLDECVAYINGTLVGIEYELKDRSIYSFDNALEMFRYVKVAQELARKSNFAEQKELDEFIDWLYVNRIQFIESEFERLNWTTH